MMTSDLSTGTRPPPKSANLNKYYSMKQPTIVFIGHVVIDRNQVEQTSYTNWGSPAMFMAKYFQSQIGPTPTIIASYGPDFMPYAYDVNLLPPKPNLAQSTVYENIIQNGHRTQFCHYGNAPLPKVTTDIQSALRQADILFLAPLAPTFTADYIAEVMAYVSSNCLKLLLPQGYLRHINQDDLVQPREFTEAAAILPYFNAVILSDEDHPQANIRAHEWKMLNPKSEIIVTLSARGADIILPQGLTHVPTTPVPHAQIVDSTGLGDIFSAAVGYNLFLGKDLAAAIKAAHAATQDRLLHTTKVSS